VTFAFKLVLKQEGDTGMTPVDAAASPEEASLFSYLETCNKELGTFYDRK